MRGWGLGLRILATFAQQHDLMHGIDIFVFPGLPESLPLKALAAVQFFPAYLTQSPRYHPQPNMGLGPHVGWSGVKGSACKS